MTPNTQFRDLLAVLRRLPSRRRKQFFLILGLMLLGALAEFVALGAVVPFMSVMADPAAFLARQQAGWRLDIVGEVDADRARVILTIGFLVVVVLAGGMRVLVSWITVRFSMLVGYDLSITVYRNLVREDYAFHLNRSSAELIGAMQKINIFAQGVLTPVMQALTAVVTVTFIIAALLIINVTVAVTTFGLILMLYLTLQFFFQPIQRRNSVTIAAAQSEKVRLVQEGFGGIRDIIVNGLHAFYINQFGTVEHALRGRQAENMFLSNAPKVIVETCLLVLAAAALYVLSGDLNNLTAILPTAVAFALGLQRMLPYMQLIYRGRAQITGNAAATSDVLGYLDMTRPLAVSKARGQPVDFRRAIELYKVSFRYGAEGAYALEDITLSIPKGSFVGITGKSGSGKSTLVDIIMGLQTPETGTLRVDDLVIDQTALPSWRSHIAHVSQSVFLIEGSIRENIALGVPTAEVDEARLQDVIRLSELTHVVAQLNEGVHTTVGERGARLSGGQRQRIGIARALYLNRDVLVLDEATSALDSDTQDKVMANIRALERGVTIISVTHRLNTLTGCDMILEFDKGRVKSDDS